MGVLFVWFQVSAMYSDKAHIVYLAKPARPSQANGNYAPATNDIEDHKAPSQRLARHQLGQRVRLRLGERHGYLGRI